MNDERAAFPDWLLDSIADDAERRADSIERWAGPGAGDEQREIAADLRAARLNGDPR